MRFSEDSLASLQGVSNRAGRHCSEMQISSTKYFCVSEIPHYLEALIRQDFGIELNQDLFCFSDHSLSSKDFLLSVMIDFERKAVRTSCLVFDSYSEIAC